MKKRLPFFEKDPLAMLCKLTLPPPSMMVLHSSPVVCNLYKNMRQPLFLSHVLTIQLLNDPVPVGILQYRRTAELRGFRISSPVCSPDVDQQFSNLQIEI